MFPYRNILENSHVECLDSERIILGNSKRMTGPMVFSETVCP